MKLIVGLGNPGNKYEKTRHNCGFMVVDALAEKLNIKIDKAKFDGLYTKTNIYNQDVLILKPLTYMNNSGLSIRQIIDYFKIDIDDVLIIYDDLDTPVGKTRLKSNGSSGGHNGIKSVIEHLNTQNFKRIRVGIGRDMEMLITDYVLKNIPKKDAIEINKAIETSVNDILAWIKSNTFPNKK